MELIPEHLSSIHCVLSSNGSSEWETNKKTKPDLRPSSGEILEVWIRVWLSRSSLWSLWIPSEPSRHACANIHPYLKHLTLKQSCCCFLIFCSFYRSKGTETATASEKDREIPTYSCSLQWVSKVSPVTLTLTHEGGPAITGGVKSTCQQEQIFPLGYMPLGLGNSDRDWPFSISTWLSTRHPWSLRDSGMGGKFVVTETVWYLVAESHQEGKTVHNIIIIIKNSPDSTNNPLKYFLGFKE